MINRLWTALLTLWGWLPIPKALRWATMWMVNQKFLVGVAVVILNDRGEVLLFKHTYRDQIPWGLPGGWLQRGENPARAVEREIMEESGLVVSVDARPLSASADGRQPHVDIVYTGRCLSGSFRPCPEVCEMGFFDLDHLPKLMPGSIELIEAAVRVM